MIYSTQNKDKVLVIPTSVYSRCCGYFSPVFLPSGKGLWNKGKTEEYIDRKYLNIDNALKKDFKGDINACTSGKTGLQQ